VPIDHQLAHITLAECFEVGSTFYVKNMNAAALLNKWVKNPNISRLLSEMQKGELHPNFGKTYDYIYGIERSSEIRKLMSSVRSGHLSHQFGNTDKWYKNQNGTEERKCSDSCIPRGWSPGRILKFNHSIESKKLISNSMRGKSNSESHNDNIRISRLGTSHSDETKEKMRLSKLGKKQSIVTCPHCNKSGGPGAMSRYHFDKCKLKDK